MSGDVVWLCVVAVFVALGYGYAALFGKLEKIFKTLKEVEMTIADILAKVTQESTLDDSIITLLTGINQQLKDCLASGDMTQLQAVSDGLDANIAKVTKAITDNTAVAPPTP